MTTLKDLFCEYVNLSYCPGTRFNRLKDIKISEYIIARLFSNGCRIIYLFNGSSIFIPWKWLDLFSSLNTHSGDKISYIERTVNLEDLNKIERIILLFSKLSYLLDRSLSKIDGEDFLEVLSEIGTTGTCVFRDWCNNEFKIELDPLEYISLDKNFEI